MFNQARKVSVFVLALVLGYLYSNSLSVDAHHQGDFFPIDRQYYKLEQKLESTGQWLWSYEEKCNQGNIFDAVSTAMADTDRRYNSVSSQSPVINQPTIVQNNVSTCGAEFTGYCGAGFAVACVGAKGARYPVDCDAFYDGPYMATFISLASKMSVVKHELTHCNSRRAEGYCDVVESMPPCNTGTTCQPSPSIMGCGPNHPLDYSSYDDSAFAVEHYPPKAPITGYAFLQPTGASFGSWYVYACGLTDNTKQIAVLVNDGTGIKWSGTTVQAQADNNSLKCQGIGLKEGLQITVGFTYYIKFENKLSAFKSFNEVCVRGSIGC
jgi:hypothetical protein